MIISRISLRADFVLKNTKKRQVYIRWPVVSTEAWVSTPSDSLFWHKNQIKKTFSDSLITKVPLGLNFKFKLKILFRIINKNKFFAKPEALINIMLRFFCRPDSFIVSVNTADFFSFAIFPNFINGFPFTSFRSDFSDRVGIKFSLKYF